MTVVVYLFETLMAVEAFRIDWDELTISAGGVVGPAAMRRVRPRGQDKWDGVGLRRRSLFGTLGLRAPLMDATEAECEVIRDHAAGARRLAEVGVFEGASAAVLREAMDPRGELTLIDPYPPGRLFGINMSRVVARRAVRRAAGGEVRWLRLFSEQAAGAWNWGQLDFLRIDGEHTLEAVQRDWKMWSPKVALDGYVALHADVVPGAVGREDELAAGDEIVPWILEQYPEWEVVSRVDTTAVLRRAHP